MTHVIRENAGGNYCGHNPLSPILDLVVPVGTGKGGVPAILGKLSARLDQYYWNPKKVLPSLNFANGSTRKQRTERREACVRLLRAIVGYTDLTSLRVGVPTKDGFVSLTMTVLAKRAGLTPSRADRAMRDLKAANLLTVSQPRQLQPDGSWKGLAAVKRFLGSSLRSLASMPGCVWNRARPPSASGSVFSFGRNRTASPGRWLMLRA